MVLSVYARPTARCDTPSARRTVFVAAVNDTPMHSDGTTRKKAVIRNRAAVMVSHVSEWRLRYSSRKIGMRLNQRSESSVNRPMPSCAAPNTKAGARLRSASQPRASEPAEMPSRTTESIALKE